MSPNPAWFEDFQDARTGAIMRRNLQTGEPELVPRNQGEAPFFMRGLFNPGLTDPTSIEPYLMASLMTPAAPVSALGYPLLGAARLVESGVRAQQGLPWMGEAGTGALYLAGGPIATKVGQGAKLAYGAAKPVVQGVARRVGGAMKSAPFDPVRRKVLQGIGAGTAALATAGTGLFQGLGGPTATKAVTKAATPMLDQFHALARAPQWTWIKGWPHPVKYGPRRVAGMREAGDRGWSVRTTPPSQRTFGTAGTGARQQIPAATLRLKNGQPVTEEMLKKAGFQAVMQGNKVIGTHPVSSYTTEGNKVIGTHAGQTLLSLMKQLDAPSQAFFRALGY